MLALVDEGMTHTVTHTHTHTHTQSHTIARHLPQGSLGVALRNPYSALAKMATVAAGRDCAASTLNKS